jgi:hypothetical protein
MALPDLLLSSCRLVDVCTTKIFAGSFTQKERSAYEFSMCDGNALLQCHPEDEIYLFFLLILFWFHFKRYCTLTICIYIWILSYIFMKLYVV